jgi:hypothetical protein
MTTIAVCRRSGRMFADSNAIDGGGLKFKTCKIVKTCDGLLGTAGNVKATELLTDWLKTRGKDWAEIPTFGEDDEVEGIALTAEGILLYSACVFPVPVDEDYFAVGTGANMVMAVLRYQEMKKLPYNMMEAMQVACDVDTNSALPIQVAELKKKKRKK